ncbi:MAG: type II toxin-antitoxin system HicA family toxin [Chloroflexota bacterium]
MPGLPRVSGKRVLNALIRAGFVESHVRGSHHYLRRPAGGLVIVPLHGNRDLPLGTLRAILRQAELTEDEFQALLNR